MTMFDLTGKVALVTGASRGIGREIAVTLGRAGATVVGTATSEAGAADISEGLKAAGVKGFGAVLNVTDTANLEPLFSRIAEELGPLAILVNNAGITRDQLSMRMKDEDWDAVIATNLSAVFKLSKLAMKPMMKARTGRMINITSVVGTSGNAGQANYAAAKAGVAGMTKALARELGSRNITVNCVAPGFIQTDMTDALNETQVDQLKQQIPLGRMGQVGDIAAAVLYLASDQAGYVTGTTLHVNGGMWMG
ncbi:MULTISPECIES: 3-oxoacyl-ACP reductase FabG [unclassified Limnobacter]|jgi:3-oxoacyl-[acyl-carrier protein] reductase|uniref:3-oxoacyl-ACP reductase FabG n=1 Tax=unclassified Limnobacter TaxID=2630203 RepID=UPI000C523859|nr:MULTISPECIES: 3-oxoacyl-ACP reductase FabG [unclassified Limnobacter]MAZ08865.1 3-oxoacyl-ACP reductase [Sutterellaceae bacterium]|tara:strand:- start:535 stop:1287 length:753 start_codon:yes stop_codon:yes gene_type:complete